MFATRSFSQCIDLNGELGMQWLLDCVLLPLHDVNFSLSLRADLADQKSLKFLAGF